MCFHAPEIGSNHIKEIELNYYYQSMELIKMSLNVYSNSSNGIANEGGAMYFNRVKDWIITKDKVDQDLLVLSESSKSNIDLRF